MRRLALSLVLSLASGLACAAGESPPAKAPIVASAAVEEALDLNLPGLTPVPSPIASADPELPLRAYPLARGRLLIHDAYRDHIAVYDPATKTQTPLGNATLVAVPRLGWLIVPMQSPLKYYDIDPQGAGLRLLWEVPADETGFVSLAPLAGNDRGAPLFVVSRWRVTGDNEVAEPGLRLVRLRGPGRVEIRDLQVPAGLSVPNSDAVRGDRLLVLRDRSASESLPGRAIEAAAVIVDLVRGGLRPLGTARGDWTFGTAMPHPYMVLRWSDHDPRARDHGWAEGCVNVVAVAEQRLTACTPQTRRHGGEVAGN